MTALNSSRHVLVDAALVVHEVGVNGERGLERTTRSKSLHDQIAVQAVVYSLLGLDRGELATISALCRAGAASAGSPALVGHALVSGRPGLGEEPPDALKPSAITGHVAVVARDDILWRVCDSLLVEAGKAAAVTKGGNGGEGPAGAAAALVDDLGDAVGVLLAEVVGLRHVIVVGEGTTRCRPLHTLEEGDGHQEARNLVLREALEALRDPGLPPRVQGLDVVELGDRQSGRGEGCRSKEEELHFKIL